MRLNTGDRRYANNQEFISLNQVKNLKNQQISIWNFIVLFWVLRTCHCICNSFLQHSWNLSNYMSQTVSKTNICKALVLSASIRCNLFSVFWRQVGGHGGRFSRQLSSPAYFNPKIRMDGTQANVMKGSSMNQAIPNRQGSPVGGGSTNRIINGVPNVVPERGRRQGG